MQRDGHRHNNDHDDQPSGHEDQPTGNADQNAYNPFDPRRLRIGQRLGEGPTTRKLVTTVQVRKPNRQEFFRVHPDPTYRLETLLLEVKAEGLTYLVDPAIGPAIPGEAAAKNAAAHQAALSAEAGWVRIAANKGAGTYDVHEALDQSGEPAWPDMSLERLLEMAFKNRFIDKLDHPVIRRLLGEF